MTQRQPSLSPRTSDTSMRYFFYGTGAALLLFAMVIAALCVVVIATRAQDTIATPPPAAHYAAYFVAPDADGIHQVWGLTLPDGQSKALTRAAQSVFDYAISDDHTQMVYMSGHQIWRQTIGQSDAKALVFVEDDADKVTVAFSPDGQSVAYHNHGLWLLNLATGNTEQLLADVPIADDAPDVLGLRIYSPLHFLDADRILINIGMWETTTRGIYILSSRTMQEVAGAYGMLELLPLEDGRYLVYSATRTGLGVDGFLVGQPAADPLEPFSLTPIMSEFFSANQLFSVGITDAVEVAPGQIHFIGTSYLEDGVTFQVFMGTYNFNTNAFTIDTSAETVEFLSTTAASQGMSPDGRYLAGYLNAGEVDNVLQGALSITDLETRMLIELTAPSPARYFEWARRS